MLAADQSRERFILCNSLASFRKRRGLCGVDDIDLGMSELSKNNELR